VQKGNPVELCLKAKSGDRKAMECLVRQYRPLMVSLANKWRGYGFDDALQEAHVAALEAVIQYSPDVGCPFGTFLKQRMRSHLRTWGRRQVRWVDRHVAASASHHGDDATLLPVEEWADVQTDFSRLPVEWAEWLDALSPREQLVLKKQVIEGYTLQEIAAEESVSRHTVHTWKKRAMKKLRSRVAEEE
jgi:RNA polymerase sigma factor (sigma-70 family)